MGGSFPHVTAVGISAWDPKSSWIAGLPIIGTWSLRVSYLPMPTIVPVQSQSPVLLSCSSGWRVLRYSRPDPRASGAASKQHWTPTSVQVRYSAILHQNAPKEAEQHGEAKLRKRCGLLLRSGLPVIKSGPEGYDSINETSVSAQDDALLLRYVCAAITQSTISTYLAQNFSGKGREAWQYMKRQFGLESLSQVSLRDSLAKLVLSGHGDCRLQLMLLDRIMARMEPEMTQTEKAETLLKKIPIENRDIKTLIVAQMHNKDEATYDGKHGAREMYIKLVTDRRRDEADSKYEGQADLFQLTDESLTTLQPTSATPKDRQRVYFYRRHKALASTLRL